MHSESPRPQGCQGRHQKHKMLITCQPTHQAQNRWRAKVSTASRRSMVDELLATTHGPPWRQWRRYAPCELRACELQSKHIAGNHFSCLCVIQRMVSCDEGGIWDHSWGSNTIQRSPLSGVEGIPQCGPRSVPQVVPTVLPYRRTRSHTKKGGQKPKNVHPSSNWHASF